MEVTKVLQDGSMFDPAVLDLDDSTILAKFKNSCKTGASFSLGIGCPSAVSAPHTLLTGFKNLVAISLSTGYKFEQGEAMIAAAMSAPSSGGAVAGKTVAAAVVEEKKEEEEDVDMGGLFGDEDEY